MKKQICNDYNEKFLTIAELAKKYNKGTETIRKILKENGCHIRNCSENAILKRNNYEYSLEEIEKDVLDNYLNKGYGLLKSGIKYNLSQNNVKYILNRHNVSIRNFSEAAKLSNENRALNKNEYYFYNESHDMAWLMGFIAADGNISKTTNRIKISLAKKDKEILEKIKRKVDIENEIKEYMNKDGFDVVELYWTCFQHKKDLVKYNIVPNKTFVLKPPYKLQKKYWIDYIRGYFDGDGSINLLNNQSLRWQICSTTKELLEWIVNYFYAEYNIPKVKILTQNRKHPLYYFQYSTESTKKIFEILYNESDMFLQRKKEHFEKILQNELL